MHGMIRFIITFSAMNGLAIPALVAQTPKLQTPPLSAEIDVVSVRALPDGNTLRQEKKMKFYRRADGSTRLETGSRVVIVDNGAHRHCARSSRENCAGPLYAYGICERCEASLGSI